MLAIIPYCVVIRVAGKRIKITEANEMVFQH